MEGFFAPPRDRVQGVKVPFVANFENFEYDGRGLPFSEFGQRQGFSNKDRSSSSLEFRGKSMQEIASLLQSWLFFGLLEEFLGQRINRLLFVDRHDASGATIWIDQDVIHDMFIDWKKELMVMSWKDQQRRKEHIEAVLEMALAKSELFDQLTPESQDFTISAIMLSVKLLIMVLQSIADDTFGNLQHPLVDSITQTWFAQVFLERRRRSTAYRKMQEVTEQKLFLPLPPGNDKPSPAAKLLLNRLVENGWCIHQAIQVCQTYDYQIVNYLSSLHRRVSLRISHEACPLSDRCIAHDVDLTNQNSYKQRHVIEGCGCPQVSVPTDDVLSIIEKGGIPIISLKAKDGQFVLKVVKCQPWTRFAAVSHVWSDGLGNAMANALPRCQIERLSKRLSLSVPQLEKPKQRRSSMEEVQSKTPHHLFWMDTLCIPVGVKDDKYVEEMKSRAISRMAPIYASATHVLVLDSELENSTSSYVYTDGSHNDDEVAAHILCSAWMGRSWTLQEAVLARTCYFQLASGPRSLSTDSWIDFFSRNRWSGLTRVFERGGQLQEERLDLRSREARRLRGSPLMRHMTRLSSQFPALVIRAIQEDKKYLSTVASTPERNKAVAALRVPQFVRAWNSLLNRSTTQPEDRHGIFANLLDFNAHHIRQLQSEQRFPKLIRSCSELPLTLLFNRGIRVSSPECPRDGWIPSEVSGDKLAGEGILRMGKDGMFIDTTHCPFDSLLIFLIPREIPLSQPFYLRDRHSDNELIIEIQDTPEDTATPSSINGNHSIESQDLSCLIIDKGTGSPSLKGYSATGALLTVTRKDNSAVFLDYVQSLMAWTPLQYSSRHSIPPPILQKSFPLIVTENTRHSYDFHLNYTPSIWGPALPRRPLLSTHPTYPTTIPYTATLLFILFSGSISLILGITGIVQIIAALCVWGAEVLVGVLVVFPAVRYFCYLTGYKQWLATFEEDWTPERKVGGLMVGGFEWVRAVREIVGAWVVSVACGVGVGMGRRRKGRGRVRDRNPELGVEEGERESLLASEDREEGSSSV
jgi:hypothetical protein